MMEATKHWKGTDFSGGAPYRTRVHLSFWNTLRDALMWSRPIEVPDVCAEDAP